MNKDAIVRKMSISGGYVQNDFVTIDMEIMATREVAHEIWRNQDGKIEIFPEKVIVKCQHCGQWCARKTACVYCGAPVD